jgi:hypothetical protein
MKFLKSSAIAITLTATTLAFAHGPRAYFEQADSNKDGTVSKAEATQYADARFADADSNKDGTISQAEVDAVHQKRRAEFEQKAQERFASKDVNKDGKLQQTEVPRMPEVMFKKLDANADGGITAEEFKAHGPGMGKGARHGEKHGDKPDATNGEKHGAGKHGNGKRGFGHGGLFKQLDGNQDGNVTKAEAQAASAQHFARLDRNSDGNITADEMPKGRPHHGNKPAEGTK